MVIGSFFERFRSRELDEILFRAAVIDSIKEVLRFELDPTSISYSNNTIFLKISPAGKNSIFIKKDLILKKIQEKTKRRVVDIR